MSTISPQGSRAGADMPLSARPSQVRQQRADSKGPSPSELLQAWFSTVALVPNHGLLKENMDLGYWRLIPKVCVGGPCLPKCPEREV